MTAAMSLSVATRARLDAVLNSSDGLLILPALFSPDLHGRNYSGPPWGNSIICEASMNGIYKASISRCSRGIVVGGDAIVDPE